MYLISDHSEQRILVLVTIWWGKKLGIDWKWVYNQGTDNKYMERFNLQKLKKELLKSQIGS
jgi:hypothetical protein